MLSIRGYFSRETFTVFQYSDSLAYFEISNQKHHRQTSYKYNILTQIIDNLLARNSNNSYMETPTIWGLNNSQGLIWEDRTDANYTTQNKWIHENILRNGDLN